MDWSNFPSLNSLRALAVVAEQNSYSDAGDVLGVSHGAVRQQIKALEAHLEITLVVRKGRGVALTAEGRTLAKDLRAAFSIMRNGVDVTNRLSDARPVLVTMSPSFAARWLVPRIADFHKKHPDVAIILNPMAEMPDPEPGGVDVAIRFGMGDWPNLDVRPILKPSLVVVGAPALIDGLDFSEPKTFAGLPWLQELGTNEVAEWMDYQGVAPYEPVKIIQMPGNLILDALRDGVGIAYVPHVFIRREIDQGHLKVLAKRADAGAYYICTRPDIRRQPARIFVNWVCHTATREKRG